MNQFAVLLQGGRLKALGVLMLALGVGLVAAWTARAYLGQRVAEIEARSVVRKVGVLVAKSPIAPGQVISVDNLAIREIPEEWHQSSAVTPEQFDRVTGQTLAFNLAPGEMLMWSMLEQRRAATFSARVAIGRRAITLPVDEISSISGMLEPDDLIDLLITVERDGKKQTRPLMQKVRVMATGQRSEQGGAGEEMRMYSTVTLDVTLAEAETLILAREIGKLTALLRHPDDGDPDPRKLADVRAFLQGVEVLETASGPKEIPILYGGRSNGYLEQEVDLPSSTQAARPSTQDNPAISRPIAGSVTLSRAR
jgi:pilus assembly protein CpaB